MFLLKALIIGYPDESEAGQTTPSTSNVDNNALKDEGNAEHQGKKTVTIKIVKTKLENFKPSEEPIKPNPVRAVDELNGFASRQNVTNELIVDVNNML